MEDVRLTCHALTNGVSRLSPVVLMNAWQYRQLLGGRGEIRARDRKTLEDRATVRVRIGYAGEFRWSNLLVRFAHVWPAQFDLVRPVDFVACLVSAWLRPSTRAKSPKPAPSKKRRELKLEQNPP